MTNSRRLLVPYVVEGDTDVPFAVRLIEAAGALAGTRYVTGGKPRLLQRTGSYQEPARRHPWLMLVDRDEQFDCAPSAARAWNPQPGAFMTFRVVEQAVEAWALGDRVAAAKYFGIRESWIPEVPESLSNPKRVLVDLARSATRREIRKDMTPRPNSGRAQGPGYEARLIEFGQTHWDPQRARVKCPSLDRALVRLESTLRHFGEKHGLV